MQVFVLCFVSHFQLTIKLADISDFFKQLPLLVAPSAGCQLLLNLNQGYSSFACRGANANDITGGAPGVPVYTPERLTQTSASFPFDTNPCVMTQPYPATVGNLPTDFSENNTYTWTLPDAHNTALTLGLYAVKPTSGPQTGLATHPQTMCRLYYSSVTLSPSYGLSLLESPNKVVEYEALQYVSYGPIATGESIQRIILSSVINAKALLLIPMLNSSRFLNSISAPLHAFTTEPATPSPCGLFSNFNVLLGGQPIYPSNKGYWETESWIDEMSTLGINGGGELGVGSSLISQAMFEQGLRYYYVNLERAFSDSRTPQSISVIGTNQSLMPLTIHAFVITKQSVMVNIATGKIVTGTA